MSGRGEPCPEAEGVQMVNRENYRHMRKYMTYLTDVKQLDRLTLDKYRKELAYLLEWADETQLEKSPTDQTAVREVDSDG